MDYGIPIATPTSTRDWLNLSQIVTQWICSLLLYVTRKQFISCRTKTKLKLQLNSLALVIYLPTSSTIISPAPPAVLSKKVAVLLWILHLLLFKFALIAGGRPEDLVFNVIRNINAVIANYLFTFIAAVGFFFQARVIMQVPAGGQGQQPNALSKWTLGLQFFTFLLLAISWPFRLILPPNMWELGMKPALLLEWYPWVGWACVNNAIMAIGQGIMLFLFIRRGAGFDGKVEFTADECRYLLGSDEL